VRTTKTSVSYLVCILYGNLGGVSMATKVLGKGNTRTKFWARKSKLHDKNSMRAPATAPIQCHFDYSSTSWFELAQNKLIGVVLKVSLRTHIDRSSFQELNWLPVEGVLDQTGLGLQEYLWFCTEISK
jgi:hypothetical protein